MNKHWWKLGKTHTILLLTAIVLLVVGGGVGMIAHNKQVQADQLAQKKQAEEAAYKKVVTTAHAAVDKAVQTRAPKDIDSAKKAVDPLKAPDKKALQQKLDQLEQFLAQLKQTGQFLDQAEKKKTDDAIAAAQKAIDAEKDPYLANDKKAHQERLDKLKKAVAEEKAKAKAKEEQEQQAQAKRNEAAQSGTPSQRKEATGTPSTAGQEDSTGQATAEGAPSGGGNAVGNGTNQPSPGYTPSGNGSSGNTPPAPAPAPSPAPSPAPTPKPTPAPTPDPTPDYDIPGRLSPWFMSCQAADAWAEQHGLDSYSVQDTSFSDGSIRYCVTK